MKKDPAPAAGPAAPLHPPRGPEAATTTAAAAGTVGLGVFLYDRTPPLPKPLPPLKDHKLARAAGAASWPSSTATTLPTTPGAPSRPWGA